jgi:hypothetical protein
VVDQATRSAFNAATSVKTSLESQKASVVSSLDVLERQFADNQAEIEAHCEQYDEDALGRSYASYLQTTISLLNQRYDTRMKAAAPQGELDGLQKMKKKAQAQYDIVTNGKYSKSAGWSSKRLKFYLQRRHTDRPVPSVWKPGDLPSH